VNWVEVIRFLLFGFIRQFFGFYGFKARLLGRRWGHLAVGKLLSKDFDDFSKRFMIFGLVEGALEGRET
jgi:hypothetical protein